VSPRREKYPVVLSESGVTGGIVDSANGGSPPGGSCSEPAYYSTL
jgi:hypothetical protein